MILKLKANI